MRRRRSPSHPWRSPSLWAPRGGLVAMNMTVSCLKLRALAQRRPARAPMAPPQPARPARSGADPSNVRVLVTLLSFQSNQVHRLAVTGSPPPDRPARTGPGRFKSTLEARGEVGDLDHLAESLHPDGEVYLQTEDDGLLPVHAIGDADVLRQLPRAAGWQDVGRHGGHVELDELGHCCLHGEARGARGRGARAGRRNVRHGGLPRRL